MTFNEMFEMATEKAEYSTFSKHLGRVTFKVAVIPDNLRGDTKEHYAMLFTNVDTGKSLVAICAATSGHLPYKGDLGEFDIFTSPLMAYSSIKLKYLVSKLWD